MPIRVLDAATVGRIAAGEVVERPSSIAKELIENSLDAGATSITVEIRDGGTTYLRVTDNGCGIPPEEARIAFENHATSKISSGDSLTDILTLGFRGEALPSIAAVSKVTMTTRAKGRETGMKLQVEGGRIMDVSEAGCPEGTTVVVKDLFFNTPVRRGFLKKTTTEAGVLSDMISRLILGNPGTAIRFINNGRTVYHSFGDGHIRHAALAVYGREVAEKMLSIDETEGSLHITGLVGIEELARANRSQEFFFINGRTVRAPLVAQALEAAVRTRVMIGQYPMCALSLSMPPTAVDINVHPSKLEVRFRDETDIRTKAELMLARACCGTKILDTETIEREIEPLRERPIIKVQSSEQTTLFTGVTGSESEPPIIKKITEPHEKVTGDRDAINVSIHKAVNLSKIEYSEPLQAIVSDERIVSDNDKKSLVFQEMQMPVARQVIIPPQMVSKSELPMRSSRTPEILQKNEFRNEQHSNEHASQIRIIGVFDNTYIIAEYNDTLILIDQHAAHERVLYERFCKALDQEVAMQPLLTPIVMAMSVRERDILLDNQSLLLEAGYEIEAFGERDIQIRAVPFVLGQAELKPLFADLVDSLDQLKNATVERRRSEIITASCKKAVKAGDHLTDNEIKALIGDMLTTEAPPNCPHGRPIFKKFKKSEIEKMFRRIV